MYEENYGKRRAYYERRKKRRRKIIARRFLCTVLIAACIVGAGIGIKRLFTRGEGKGVSISIPKKPSAAERLQKIEIPDFIDPQLIHVHTTARTGTQLEDIKDIVIHYVGNPGTTAQNNRDFFDKDETEVSSHFVVGLKGEIIQCLPLWERSAASNDRNKDTISIEVCHPDDTGKFNDATYTSVVKLTAWLLKGTGLSGDNVIRHYDVTGKLCPIYYVNNPDKWEAFKKDVKTSLAQLKEK